MTNPPSFSHQSWLSRQLLTRVGTTLLLIGVIVLSLNYFWKITDSKQQVRHQAQSITDSLGLIIPEYTPSEAVNDWAPILQQMSRVPNLIQVDLLTPEGDRIGSSVANRIAVKSSFWLIKIQPKIQQVSLLQAATYFSTTIEKQPVFVYITPLKSLLSPVKTSSQIAVVVLDLQPIFTEARRAFLVSALLLIGECLIVLILIGICLRQAVLTPLNQLHYALSQYQQGTSLPIPERLPVNEIGLLAKAIYQQFIDLKQINAQLKIEIIERQKAEDKIKVSLEEKELLLREIHHRVKNNLFIVSQLLEMQSDCVDNSQLSQILKDCQDRIYAMVLIHETLYQTTNLKNINFAEYLKSLIFYLNQSYHSCQKAAINIQLELQPIILNIETANPCGLIINELVSNAFKHAFKGKATGKIKVSLTQNEINQIELQIEDNGIGFPKNIDFQQVNSLGLELVNTLTQQLQGTLELDCRGEGTLFKLTFTELSYNKC
ncbi:MAG: histidine kinase dimerization/phosphoacceptor domain -containing protein [Microcoleaceae cyanobacterium]